MTLRTDCYSIIPFTGYLSIAHLVEWRTVAPTLLIILRSLVRFQLEAGVGCFLADFLMVQMVNCLPTRREILVQSLGQEDPLEKEMPIHSSTLAWKIPWMEPGGLQSMGSQRVGHD